MFTVHSCMSFNTNAYLLKYGEIIGTDLRQLMRKCKSILCHLNDECCLFFDSQLPPIKFVCIRSKKTICPRRLPVCAELRTSNRTGVLSWTTLGWMDTAARADKQRWRNAWWDCCSEASLLSSWSMGSAQGRGKVLSGLFMVFHSADVMLKW